MGSTGGWIGAALGFIGAFFVASFIPGVGLLGMVALGGIGLTVGGGVGMIIDPPTFGMDMRAPDSVAAGSPEVEEFQISTIKDGQPMPDLCGITSVAGVLIGYGGNRAEDIVKYLSVPLPSSEGAVAEGHRIGYKYYLTWAIGLSLGVVDELFSIKSEDLTIASGNWKQSTYGDYASVDIGEMGTLYFYYGTTTQTQDSVLASKTGDDHPPYRRLCYAVFRDAYMGKYNRAPRTSFVIGKWPDSSNLLGDHGDSIEDWTIGHTPMYGSDPTEVTLGSVLSEISAYKMSMSSWGLWTPSSYMYRNLGDVFGTSTKIRVKSYHTGNDSNFNHKGDSTIALVDVSSGLRFWAMIASRYHIESYDDGKVYLYIHDGADFQRVSGVEIEQDTWDEWIFEIDHSIEASASVNITRNGTLVASGVDCSYTGSYTAGYVYLAQHGSGFVARDDTLYIDYFYANGATSGQSLMDVPSRIGNDCNPAYAIWYILETMIGLPQSMIATDVFNEAAFTLHGEQLGISIFVNKYQRADQYLENILSHIGAVLRPNNKGQFELKLIRYDTAPADLPVITEDEVVEPIVLSRGSWDETTNEVKVQYYRYWRDEDDNDFFKDATVTAQDIAVKEIVGRTISKTVKLGLFTTQSCAAWGADRLLKQNSYPRAKVQIPVNRYHFGLQCGDAFKLEYAPYGITAMYFRVDRITEEDPTSEKIIIEALEDLDYMAPTGLADTADVLTSVVDYTVSDLTDVGILEAPYEIEDSETIYIIPLAGKEKGYELKYILYMSTDGGSSYSAISSVYTFNVVGSVETEYTEDTYEVDDEVGLRVTIPDHESVSQITTRNRDSALAGANLALVGDEIISFETITPDTGDVYVLTGVVRGMFDTVPATHAVGTKFYFFGQAKYVTLTNDEFTIGATRHFKMVPYSALDSADLSTATAISHTFAGRAKTPYPVNTIRANDNSTGATYSASGDIVFTWWPRVRGSGAGKGDADAVTDYDPANNYEHLFKIETYSGGALKNTYTGIDAVTWTYTNANLQSDHGGEPSEIEFKIYNYRSVDGQELASSALSITVTKE